MSRLLVALGHDVGITPSELAVAWERDEEASAIGRPILDEVADGFFLSDLLTLIVIPLVVNVSSSAAYELVQRLVAKMRRDEPGEPDLDVELKQAKDDLIVVVRVSKSRS